MTLSSQSVTSSMEASLREVLAEETGETGEMLAIGFDEDLTKGLIEVLWEMEDSPTVHVLARDEVLKWARADFVLASAAAELVETGRLELRTAPAYLENVLVVSEELVVSLVRPDERVGAFVTDDEKFVEAAGERWESAFEEGEEFDLRTPVRSRVLDSLGEAFDSKVQTDFREVLEALGSTRDEKVLDEVGVSLVVAARHEELLYDISKWGEDSGVASKATFSRKKTRLEEQGLLDTEKVPIDVGRPRLRLLLGDERLEEASSEDVPSVVRELFSAVPAE